MIEIKSVKKLPATSAGESLQNIILTVEMSQDIFMHISFLLQKESKEIEARLRGK